MLLRALKWVCPIERGEWGLFLKFSLLMVLITANFWLAHNLKDTLVMTAPASGAECINYLKVLVFFATLGFVATYSKIQQQKPQKKVLRSLIIFFCVVYTIFAWIIPYSDALQMHPNEVSALQIQFPACRWIFPVLGYWVYSLFYVISEMWAMTAYAIFFWQFANTMLPLDKGRRFYALFVSFNGLSTVIFAKIALWWTDSVAGSFEDYLLIIRLGCCLISVICIALMLCHHMIYIHVGLKSKQEQEAKLTNTEEERVSFFAGLRTVVGSWYLGLIFLLGVCYNMAHTFVDVTWKQQVKLLCRTPFAVQSFFWSFTLKMGYGIILCSLMSSSFIRRFEWRVGASITPIILGVSGMLFFCSILLRGWELATFATVIFTVTYGQWHELVVKSLKHSIFNVTRELVYVPLDFSTQVRGKAIADVLGGRVGKLMGAGLQGVLLFLVGGGTQEDTVPYAIALFLSVIAVWFVVIKMLSIRFRKLVAYNRM